MRNYHPAKHRADDRYAAANEILERLRRCEIGTSRNSKREIQHLLIAEIAQRLCVKPKTVTKWVHMLLKERYAARQAIAQYAALPPVEYKHFCAAIGWSLGN